MKKVGSAPVGGWLRSSRTAGAPSAWSPPVGYNNEGALQRWRQRPIPTPYPASAGGRRKRKESQREGKYPCRHFAGGAGAHGNERRCGRPTHGAGGVHRASEAVRARHVSARNPGPASTSSLRGRCWPSPKRDTCRRGDNRFT